MPFLDLSLTQVQEAVRLRRKDEETGDEVAEWFAIVEPSGKDRDLFLNQLGNRARVDRSGAVQGVKNFEGLQADLISRCLFPCVVEESPSGEPVLDEDGMPKILEVGKKSITAQSVQKYPATAQGKIFERCQELAGLSKDAEDDAKND